MFKCFFVFLLFIVSYFFLFFWGTRVIFWNFSFIILLKRRIVRTVRTVHCSLYININQSIIKQHTKQTKKNWNMRQFITISLKYYDLIKIFKVCDLVKLFINDRYITKITKTKIIISCFIKYSNFELEMIVFILFLFLLIYLLFYFYRHTL